MNYSDYDSENYSSDEDADYVPSDDNLSEDDMTECVNEDALEAPETDRPAQDVKKKSRKSVGVRKRKKGDLKLEDDSGQQVEEGDVAKQKDDEKERDEGTSTEELEKKKADDLWASFLSDVGPRPKHSVSAQTAPVTPSKADSDSQDVLDKVPSEPEEYPEIPEDKPKELTKITITKVFDFAGEEVQVTKEVDADSREARSFLKTEEEEEEEPQQNILSKPSVPFPASGPSVKRPSGIGSVLGRIGGKKQKMSTLEKSRLDWDAFKEEEGIGEELATHNRGKDGYLERKSFLERVDYRQFELERNVRMNNMKR
ncbi:craniofacial development protein 1 [Scleropages formosus]|nr:craniofacial development protein 1 [Scleropages formosus]